MKTINVSSSQIGAVRVRKGLSLRELSEIVGITASSLSAIERGKANPRPKTAKRLCDALGVDFDELFTISERGEVQP